MREHYWPSTRELADARFLRFLKELAVYERQLEREEQLNAFLDAYSCWRRTHDAAWRAEVERRAQVLHALDAHFSFHFEREPVT